MSTTLHLNLHKNRYSSKKSFSVFMLFSLVVCCFSSVVSCFENSSSDLQQINNSKFVANGLSTIAKKSVSHVGFNVFSSDVESDSPIECSNLIRKKSSESNSSKPFQVFSVSSFDCLEYSLFFSELKRLEKNNKNNITENIGITERFQV